MSKFKVGDRVRISHCNINCCHDQIGTVTNEGRFPHGQSSSGHDFYWEHALELVTKGGDMDKPHQRKTYMLRVESPSLKKGALVQERCDDGTQPYDLINPETHSKDPSFNVSFAKRELVEDAPKFWVEVFKVTPEYMTADELAQWEAFKARKKPGRKAGVKAVEKPATKKRAWTPAQRKEASERAKARWAAKKAA